jgi:hypothetical protein
MDTTSLLPSRAVEALGLFQQRSEKEGLLAALESLAVAALAQGRKQYAARLLGRWRHRATPWDSPGRSGGAAPKSGSAKPCRRRLSKRRLRRRGPRAGEDSGSGGARRAGGGVDPDHRWERILTLPSPEGAGFSGYACGNPLR